MYVLASGSPRRKELLQLIIPQFDIQVSGCEEIVPEGTPVNDIPRLLAIQKAKAVSNERPDDIIIGADTIVVLNNQIFGKPKNKDDAKRMLHELSGKDHFVYTGVAIINGENITSFVSKTVVSFYELSDEIINQYVDSGEPMDKAGAYGIQGKGCILVKKIDGDYFTVVGFPVSETARYLNIV